jgi:hypothetical protein
MIVEIVVGIVLMAGGFALGRIKNFKKLAAIKADLEQAEKTADSEMGKLISILKKKL